MSMNLEAFEGQEVIVHTVGGVTFEGELTLIPTFSGNGSAVRVSRVVYPNNLHTYLAPESVIAVQTREQKYETRPPLDPSVAHVSR